MATISDADSESGSSSYKITKKFKDFDFYLSGHEIFGFCSKHDQDPNELENQDENPNKIS
jgi:hypothetical protein